MGGRMVRAGAALVAAAAALVMADAASGASPFAWRGIVEGPYGVPWDHGQRTRVLRWMPAHGFNAYVHAPKDDLYQRTNWRDPYPAAQQAEFDREIGAARKRKVEWIPNLSPALPLIPTPAPPAGPASRDLCFSCPADLEVVLAKLQPFRAAGARTFMISFDDVSKGMSHPEDTVAYGTGDEAFGKANGDFLSRLYAALVARAPGARLLTVGADYSGTSDTAYLRGLRSTLRPEVDVMWTGKSIPAQPFTPQDAAAYGQAIGRQPAVWDNWTNNDTAGNIFPSVGAARIFLGPYKRAADVAGSVKGFFFNPMNEADLNLLPLATAGDWMRDPRSYRGRASWRRAVNELAGRKRTIRTSLRAWAETSYSHKLDEAEAPTFVRRSKLFLDRYRRGPGWVEPHTSLLKELALAREADRALRGMRNGSFYAQAEPWLAAARQAANAGALGAELLAAERPALRVRRRGSGFDGTVRPPDPGHASELRSRYDAEKKAMVPNKRFVYGWKGGTAFEFPPCAVPENVMLTFFDAVDELDGAWQPRADQAGGGVTLTLGGRRVKVSDDGRFKLGRSACGRTLTATDAAGGATARRVPRCRRG